MAKAVHQGEEKREIITIYRNVNVLKELSRQDSNLGQENQNLWCCHYTTGQENIGY
jgi:hypothetical protein